MDHSRLFSRFFELPVVPIEDMRACSSLLVTGRRGSGETMLMANFIRTIYDKETMRIVVVTRDSGTRQLFDGIIPSEDRYVGDLPPVSGPSIDLLFVKLRQHQQAVLVGKPQKSLVIVIDGLLSAMTGFERDELIAAMKSGSTTGIKVFITIQNDWYDSHYLFSAFRNHAHLVCEMASNGLTGSHVVYRGGASTA